MYKKRGNPATWQQHGLRALWLNDRKIQYDLIYIVNLNKNSTHKKKNRGFPGGPMVKALSFQCRGYGFDTYIPHARKHDQRKQMKFFLNPI